MTDNGAGAALEADRATGVRRRSSTGLSLLLSQQFILLVVLILMVVVFTAINPRFFSVGVFGNILVTWAPIALIAVGQTFVVVSGGIDLSVGSTITISGVVAAFAMQYLTGTGIPDALSLLVGVITAAAVGLVVGVVNAVLINQAKLVDRKSVV